MTEMEDFEERPARPRRRGHSLFWPILLIGVGVIWLLAAGGLITTSALETLTAFWPLILIFIGLDMLFGRGRPLVGLILGFIALAIVIGILVASPNLQANTFLGGDVINLSSELKHQDLVAPSDGVESAHIDLGLSSWPVTIDTLEDSENLITASIDYTGSLDWQDTQANGAAQISLRHQQAFSLGQLFSSDAKWHFAISSDVPMELVLDGGSGPVTADLGKLQLTSFEYDGGSGPANLTLPSNSTETLTSFIDGGSGSLRISLPDGGDHQLSLEGGSGSYNLSIEEPADLNLILNAASGSGYVNLAEGTSADITLDGGSGSTKIVIEGNPGIRLIIASQGSGSVYMPSSLTRTTFGDDENEGTWETANFDSAEQQIIIRADLASGSFTLTN